MSRLLRIAQRLWCGWHDRMWALDGPVRGNAAYRGRENLRGGESDCFAIQLLFRRDVR